MTMPSLPQLLCFPPAGGGPSLYYPWAQRHRDRLGIHAVAVPGRETRIAEPPRNLDALADVLADELAPRAAHRYAMFGYSMGAVLAYEVARRWARRGLPAPEIVFILSCNPPDRLLAGRDAIHAMPEAAFWQTVLDLGGTPRELLDFPEARALFEPILRNDFRICETYEHRADGTRLNCPAHAFIAEGDTLADAETADGWRAFFAGPFQMHALRGNHMLEKAPFAALLDSVLALWPDRSGSAPPPSHRLYAG
jgi:surfactin synthase thioesterase subunit